MTCKDCERYQSCSAEVEGLDTEAIDCHLYKPKKGNKMKNISPLKFYILSFTWGLPMSLAGLIVCGVLMCFGCKPKRYGPCFYMAVGGKNWGGFELGWFFLVDKSERERTKQHELGHGYQNACQLGWIYPIFCLIGVVRYWLKRFGVKINYYGWWLEGNANKIGAEVMNHDT